MNKLTSRRRNQRIELDPPEVGILFLKEDGYVLGTNPTPQPRQLFIDLINRSLHGVGIRTEKKIEPATNFYLHAFNKAKKSWELFEGRTKWLLADREKGIFHQVGAELKSTQVANGLFMETEEDHHDKRMPMASDYQFFRKTDLLKSVSRDAVCPLLNCITFQHVKAGQRFITQENPEIPAISFKKGPVWSMSKKTEN